MNKVFKVVWSATKHAYVVTSELAKSHQKSATTIVAAVILAAFLEVLLMHPALRIGLELILLVAKDG